MQIPSYRMVSNGLEYVFYTFDSKNGSITASAFMELSLRLGMTAGEATAAAGPLIRVLSGILARQRGPQSMVV